MSEIPKFETNEYLGWEKTKAVVDFLNTKVLPWIDGEVKKHIKLAHASERAEVLAEVVEVLEFYAQGGNFQSDIWQHPDLGFFTGKRARELLQKLKGEK